MAHSISKPSQLVARLKAVYNAETHEDLARQLNVPLRTLQRWATDTGSPNYATTVKLLAAAGWLAINGNGETTGDPAVGDETLPETALLTRIVEELEQDPDQASGELAPAIADLASQLSELAARLRQATARTSERWHSG